MNRQSLLCSVIAALLVATASLRAAAPSARLRGPKSGNARAIHEANLRIDEINRAKNLRVDSSDKDIQWLGYRTEGGAMLRGYFRKDTLCKITADMYHAFGMVRIEIFYSGNEPVFFYEREDYYRATDTSVDRTVLEYGHDARYYVRHGALIDSRRRGKDRHEKTFSPAEDVKKLLLMSERWSAFLKH